MYRKFIILRFGGLLNFIPCCLRSCQWFCP